MNIIQMSQQQKTEKRAIWYTLAASFPLVLILSTHSFPFARSPKDINRQIRVSSFRFHKSIRLFLHMRNNII